MLLLFFFFFFFFQAEDGIRDWSVTGVQTCALPILDSLVRVSRRVGWVADVAADPVRSLRRPPLRGTRAWPRSEERRVGKECRSRWSPDHEKKNADTAAEKDTRHNET